MMRDFGRLCASAGPRSAAFGSRFAAAAMAARHRRRRLRTIVQRDARAAICALRPFLAER
ncbi:MULTISPECIES: hypothetical protein [unclassified Lysobacter]|uniref:hypothetical protein n=1 Tax=unclassified Lysobacter TaxID=2635362 RepID=UPI001BE70636|nr:MULTISPECIES: hypothetical protein [unclassified Lysobacter]MBT2746359.1 hypothetical protein [Lysobacter sp. ISL-42]MBT2751168.1 hypothetical protein [Lysobacter sp. ISL-50]MBT2775576.1 hypothetical protein [Lysobacter sp. ISL-54]MBT2779961.1 hypothetical protein [Lysobacter sp. ISL-52]